MTVKPHANGRQLNRIDSSWTQIDDATTGAGYASLEARFSNLVLSGGNVASLTNGAAAAAQKAVVLDDTTGFIAGARVSYLLVGGAVEFNTIDTVDSGTNITLITNIGTGGIADNTYFSMISEATYQIIQSINRNRELTVGDFGQYVSMDIYHVGAYGTFGAAASAANNSAAITAAVNAAAAAGGGVVFIPPVSANINAMSFTSKNKVTVWGSGLGISILTLAASQNDHAFAFTTCDNITIRDITIDGNKASQTAGAYDVARFSESDAGQLLNCELRNGANIGANFMGCTDWYISGCRTSGNGTDFSGVTGAGIYVRNNAGATVDSKRFLIVGCFSDGDAINGVNNEGAGIFTSTTTTEVQIIGCHSKDSNKYGFKIQGTFITLSGCTAVDPVNTAFALQGTDIELDAWQAIRAGNNGVSLAHFSTTDDHKNVRIGSGYALTPDQYGVDITNTVNPGETAFGVTVTGVTVEDSNNHGFRVRGGWTEVILQGCRAYANTDRGFWVTEFATVSLAPSKVLLLGCISHGNDDGFVLFDGSGAAIGCWSHNNTTTEWNTGGSNWRVMMADARPALSNASQIVTIATGVLALGSIGSSYISVAAESGTADNLDSITGGSEGDEIVLRADTGDTITVVNSSSIATRSGANVSLTGNIHIKLFCRDGSNWSEL